MDVVAIATFGGVVLTKDAKKGPFWTALQAVNCDIQSGSIDVAYVLSNDDRAQLVGNVPKKTLNNITGATFLEWSVDVDVVRSLLANNSSNRVYYAGDDIPKVTDRALAPGGPPPFPAVAYTLGLPIPPDIVRVTEVVATGNPETRAYLS